MYKSTRWYPLTRSRLRTCLLCSNEFASTSAANRICSLCQEKEDSKRARAGTENKDVIARQFFDDHFDPDMLNVRNWRKAYDDRVRRRRQKMLGITPLKSRKRRKADGPQ